MLGSLYYYFGILCRKGKVFEKDEPLLNLTMKKFNQLFSGAPAKVTARVTQKGEIGYTLSTSDGQGIPENEYKRMLQNVAKP